MSFDTRSALKSDPGKDVSNQVGVAPVDVPGSEVACLKQDWDLEIFGSAIDPDFVSHSPVAAVVDDHRHARPNMQEHWIRLGRGKAARMIK